MEKKFDVVRVDYYRQHEKVCSFLVPIQFSDFFHLRTVCNFLNFDGCITTNVSEDILDFLNNMTINGKEDFKKYFDSIDLNLN